MAHIRKTRTPRIPRVIADFNTYIRRTADYLLELTLAPITMAVPKASSVNILTMDFADTMTVTMENTGTPPGADALNFCTAPENTDACDLIQSIEVNPGESQMRTIAELGGAAKRHLNVTNPSANKNGSCRVTLPLNWKRLLLNEGQNIQWQELRKEWAELYKLYSDKRHKRTPEIRDLLLNVKNRFIEFAQPALEHIQGVQTAGIADFEVFRIKSGALRDSTPTRHEAPTELLCHARLKNIAGGSISYTCNSDADSKRGSKEPGYEIQTAYSILSAGEPAPMNAEQAQRQQTLTRAKGQLRFGGENLTKILYIWFRWFDPKRPELSGNYGARQSLVIA